MPSHTWLTPRWYWGEQRRYCVKRSKRRCRDLDSLPRQSRWRDKAGEDRSAYTHTHSASPDHSAVRWGVRCQTARGQLICRHLRRCVNSHTHACTYSSPRRWGRFQPVRRPVEECSVLSAFSLSPKMNRAILQTAEKQHAALCAQTHDVEGVLFFFCLIKDTFLLSSFAAHHLESVL